MKSLTWYSFPSCERLLLGVTEHLTGQIPKTGEKETYNRQGNQPPYNTRVPVNGCQASRLVGEKGYHWCNGCIGGRERTWGPRVSIMYITIRSSIGSALMDNNMIKYNKICCSLRVTLYLDLFFWVHSYLTHSAITQWAETCFFSMTMSAFGKAYSCWDDVIDNLKSHHIREREIKLWSYWHLRCQYLYYSR
jgi:hypothetical protein